MSATIATAKSQHGTTNSGTNKWTSSTFPKGYRFRGDASDASLFKAFEEEVITSALALEGFKFIWLLEKQVPDPTLYEDDDGDMTTRDKQSLQKKKEEIEDKEMKVFGILIDLIEPGKRAWTLINEVIKTGDPVAVYKVLKERYGSNTVPGFFEYVEKLFDPIPEGEDLLHFLNRMFKHLTEFRNFGSKMIEDEDGTFIKLHPNAVSEETRIMIIFAMARKLPRYALELDDFILDHLLTLNFESTGLSFSSIYEKLVSFLRNKETITPAKSQIESSVFTTQMVNVFNTQWQKRVNQKRKFEAHRNFNQNPGRGRGSRGRSSQGRGHGGRFGKFKCKVHGDQSDHSDKYCPDQHPEVAFKIQKLKERRDRDESKGQPSTPLHEKKDTEVNLITSVPDSQVKFQFGVNSISVHCNLTSGEVISAKKIFDSGSSGNVVNRFYRKQIQNFQPCDGTVIGAGGKIVGAIVGVGYIQVLGYLMPVYYGPELPKSVFSIGVFARDFGFEIWFKDHVCVVWIPRKLEGEDFNDFEVLPLSEDYLYEIPESWFN